LNNTLHDLRLQQNKKSLSLCKTKVQLRPSHSSVSWYLIQNCIHFAYQFCYKKNNHHDGYFFSQMCAFCHLYAWRDNIAREEDESTGWDLILSCILSSLFRLFLPFTLLQVNNKHREKKEGIFVHYLWKVRRSIIHCVKQKVVFNINVKWRHVQTCNINFLKLLFQHRADPLVAVENIRLQFGMS